MSNIALKNMTDIMLQPNIFINREQFTLITTSLNFIKIKVLDLNALK